MLRSAALQRSNRALLNSKRHLRRRDLREGGAKPVTGAKRGPKGRRKLRSSGFDYLRKKKKKKDISDTTPRKVRTSSDVDEIPDLKFIDVIFIIFVRYVYMYSKEFTLYTIKSRNILFRSL